MDKIDFFESFFIQTQEFELALNRIRTLNSALKVSTERLLKSLRELKLLIGDKPVCPICFDPTTTMYVVVPCGHCICRDCRQRLANPPRCFSCRGPVDNTLRLYL